MSINDKQYWEEVANNIGAELEDISISKYSREIEMSMSIKNQKLIIFKFTILHNWKDDGSSSKPVTKLICTYNVPTGGYDDFELTLGRFSIWDDPKSYAEDIYNILLNVNSELEQHHNLKESIKLVRENLY